MGKTMELRWKGNEYSVSAKGIYSMMISGLHVFLCESVAKL